MAGRRSASPPSATVALRTKATLADLASQVLEDVRGGDGQDATLRRLKRSPSGGEFANDARHHKNACLLLQKFDFLRATRALALPSVGPMAWPPEEGELLPRASEAIGIRQKLIDYSLDPSHKVGGPKAVGFARILGITLHSVDYLEAEIEAGILVTPIRSTRENPPHGINCVVEFTLRGIGPHRRRAAALRTIWELTDPQSAPRLVNAFLKS
jgi:hypothetical protein